MKKLLQIIVIIPLLAFVGSSLAQSRLRLQVNQPIAGAPLTLGIPFPKGVLHSPDHVRVLNAKGKEIPSQITEVTTWMPADESIKWIWVFFFCENSDRYFLEYGKNVVRAPIPSERIAVNNNQRARGYITISTGPLRFRINKKGNGFLDKVELDLAGDGFDENDIIAEGPEGRGSFLDILDDIGLDKSKAVIKRNWIEKGSGPLHMIIRAEGEYQYSRDDNNPSPFVLRVHAYAGKSYVRVLHTLTYTGEPDKHKPFEGEHALIATGSENIIDEETLVGDPGWTQPNDRIAAAGLSLDYKLSGELNYLTSYRKGEWWQPGDRQFFETLVASQKELSIIQSGPKPTRMPPVPNSTPEERIDGFFARIASDSETLVESSKADGWIDISDQRWGISVGMRRFFEEYPKEISLDIAAKEVTAFSWSPDAEPMSFARLSSELDGGMVSNFAQGLTKTTELVYNFHKAGESRADIENKMRYFLDPPVAHAEPEWYANSEVYGSFAPASEKFPEFERGLDYKFKWMLFNQNWEPWYGMFDYGDRQTYYYNMDWILWNNNEPGQDYMRWLHFMRTGDREIYLSAEAASRHSMDVDNIHWPADPEYIGDSNYALDYWKEKEQPQGNPYLGMGAREGRQHWGTLYSAHVWTMGWIASYYLTGYHRGLEVAKLTAETYLKHIWGEHDLRGRRLYLSVWNLAEIYDATKDERYLEELKDRVNTMLRLQQPQGGSLVLDRYGYAQVYVSHGLRKYLQLTGEQRVQTALVRHARWLRDVPPRNHGMESFLSTIHSLLLGYKLSGEPSLFREAVKRAELLKTDKLSDPNLFDGSHTQLELFNALESVDHMPPNEQAPDRRPNWTLNGGSRVFGWTHAYNVPYLLYWLEKQGYPEK
ncbi:hypothetical protein IH879_14335 [candidate division KSB1 bacterium]|nr:hypothetical protein [candidate division KSB1 bacterium]